jgi:hypothetical protein
MNQKLIIALPYHLPLELSPNASRECPQGMKNRLLEEVRNVAKPLMADARNTWERVNKTRWEALDKCRLGVTIYYHEKRNRDKDNIYGNRAWKAIQDILVETELIVDDSSDHLTVADPVIVVDKKYAPLIILEVGS